MKFGDNLRKLRKIKNISQEELADKVGVSRQSVSKWETGDAYPEMNNILQLCKTFHCKINDLVNDSIIDIDSLDDEIKMSVVKFKKEKQEKVKTLSKVIYILAMIGRIIMNVGIVCVVIAMMIIPVVTSNIKVEDNQMIIFGQKVEYERNSKEIIIRDSKNEEKLIDKQDVKSLNEVIDYVENNNMVTATILIELAFGVLVATLVFTKNTFKHLEKLFVNIHNGDTPFTMENVDHIKKMAYLLIWVIILPFITGVLSQIVFRQNLDVELELMDLIYILCLYSLSYIFEYGYEIQLDSKGKMYGNVEG